MFYTPPRSYLDLIRYGRHRHCLCKVLRGLPAYNETVRGTSGRQCHYDPGLARRLTQVLVQQGYDDARIRREHMKPSNMGFLWVRRQDDQYAASQALIDQCDRNKRPILSTAERHRRILTLLSTGEIVSQKQLIRAVGTARDSDTQNDLRELEREGAITVAVERHGKVGWKRIYLSVSAPEFRTISYTLRRALAETIRKSKAVYKGFKRLPKGRQPSVAMPAPRTDLSLQTYLTEEVWPFISGQTTETTTESYNDSTINQWQRLHYDDYEQQSRTDNPRSGSKPTFASRRTGSTGLPSSTTGHRPTSCGLQRTG